MKSSTKKALELIQKAKQQALTEMGAANAKLQQPGSGVSHACDVIGCSKALRALDRAEGYLNRMAERERKDGKSYANE